MPAKRVHVGELKVPEASLQVIVPVGVTGVPTSLSVTVAVHVVGAFTGIEAGTQLTAVEVERWVAVREKLLELREWSVSPP